MKTGSGIENQMLHITIVCVRPKNVVPVTDQKERTIRVYSMGSIQPSEETHPTVDKTKGKCLWFEIAMSLD